MCIYIFYTYMSIYIYIHICIKLFLVAYFGTDEGRSTFLFRPKYLLFKF